MVNFSSAVLFISMLVIPPSAFASQQSLVSNGSHHAAASISMQRLMAARRKINVTGSFPPGIKAEIQHCLSYGYEPGWHQGDEHVECVP